MSALTAAEIAIKIRRRMNAPVSDRLRYHPLINDALLLLAREVAGDKSRRHLMLTDKATTTVVLAAGVADLTALIASPRILVDKLDCGEIYDPSNPNPLVRRQQGARPGNWDSIYLHYVLDGVKLKTQSSDNNVTPLIGPLSLAVPYWATLALLQEQLVPALVEKGCELLQENRRDYEAEGDDE